MLKSKKNVFPISIRKLHGEDIIFGSMTNMSKKAPSGRLKFNPTVDVDISTGKFIISPEDLETIYKIDGMLSNTIQDTSIVIEEDIADLNDVE